MKIAYFTDSPVSSVDGVTNSLYNLSSALSKRGFKIHIFAPESESKRKNVKWKSLKGVETQLLPSIKFPQIERTRVTFPISPQITDNVRGFNPDVLHFHNPFMTALGATILAKLLKKPIVGTFHTYFMTPEYLKSVGINGNQKFITNLLWYYTSLFYNQCDVVIVPSQVVRKDLQKNGIKKPIRVISNFIDESSIKKLDKNSLLKLKKLYELKKHVLIYVGRLSQEKSLEILIKSFSLVLRKSPKTSLLIVGTGPIENDLKRLAEKLKIRENIVFAGEIKHDQLLCGGYFQIADVFVTASTSDVQPISLIEAMYFGVPLIGVSKRGVSDLADGIGLLSPPNNTKRLADSITRTLENQGLKKRLGRLSRKAFLDRHSSKKVIDQYKKLYKKLV